MSIAFKTVIRDINSHVLIPGQMKIMFAFAFSLFCAAGTAMAGSSERSLSGDWCSRDKPAYFEELKLDISGGKQLFNAYLHQRPVEFGTWRLNKDKLIFRSSDIVFIYRIVKHTRSELVLADEKGEQEFYFRSRCVKIARS